MLVGIAAGLSLLTKDAHSPVAGERNCRDGGRRIGSAGWQRAVRLMVRDLDSRPFRAHLRAQYPNVKRPTTPDLPHYQELYRARGGDRTRTSRRRGGFKTASCFLSGVLQSVDCAVVCGSSPCSLCGVRTYCGVVANPVHLLCTFARHRSEATEHRSVTDSHGRDHPAEQFCQKRTPSGRPGTLRGRLRPAREPKPAATAAYSTSEIFETYRPLDQLGQAVDIHSLPHRHTRAMSAYRTMRRDVN
jgi:hypothetical protein